MAQSGMNALSARSSRLPAVLIAAAVLAAWRAPVAAQGCVGDCNSDGTVGINELIIGVNIALGAQQVSACPAFANDQGAVDIAQLIKGVNNALGGCAATPTPTATGEPTVEPTGPIPPGQAVAGRSAIVAVGLGSVQSIVTAVVTTITGGGGSSAVEDLVAVNGAIDVDDCPVSGTTSQECEGGGIFPPRPIMLTLGAQQCVANGPAGGTAKVDGSIVINSTSGVALCEPVPIFQRANFDMDASVVFRDALMQALLSVTADLTGTVNLTADTGSDCLVQALDLVLDGNTSSTLADGSGAAVDFDDTTVRMDNIQFNDDCVPLKYRLTFNGPATFTPSVPGETPDAFEVGFSNFVLEQDATVSPVEVRMQGGLTSDCFGGALALQTLAPIGVTTGELCPTTGELSVTSAGPSATVSYEDGAVTVTEAGMAPEVYPSCLAAELLQCD